MTFADDIAANILALDGELDDIKVAIEGLDVVLPAALSGWPDVIETIEPSRPHVFRVPASTPSDTASADARPDTSALVVYLDLDGRSGTLGGASNRFPQGWTFFTELINAANITTLSSYAFSNCTALRKVDGLEGVTGSIDYNAFAYCSALTNVDGLEGVTGSIGSYAFSNCTALTNVDGLTGATGSIDDGAFYYCTALTNVDGLTGVTGSIGGSAFYYCSALTNVDGLTGVTGSIGSSAFYYCSALTNVDGLTGVTGSIGRNAFASCKSLTNVDGLTGVTGSIGDSAFKNCSSLTKATFAATSFASPSASAGQFYSCTNLEEIHLTAPTMCTILGTTDYEGLPASFRYCPAHVIVPDNLVAEYRANARWALMNNAGRLHSESEWAAM